MTATSSKRQAARARDASVKRLEAEVLSAAKLWAQADVDDDASNTSRASRISAELALLAAARKLWTATR